MFSSHLWYKREGTFSVYESLWINCQVPFSTRLTKARSHFRHTSWLGIAALGLYYFMQYWMMTCKRAVFIFWHYNTGENNLHPVSRQGVVLWMSGKSAKKGQTSIVQSVDNIADNAFLQATSLCFIMQVQVFLMRSYITKMQSGDNS